MYSACIHCNAPLGANEMLERFPVGRRIAFDQATGRLWVVCRKCERWNLSPLETRWEAIEDAEQLFRATRLKVTGENIALAQTNEGLELVRIGAPPKKELLAWRYGDQFGRRRRKHLIWAGLGVAGTVATGAYGVASLAGFGTGLVGVFTAANLIGQAGTWKQLLRGRHKRLHIPGPTGAPLILQGVDAVRATLVPDASEGWRLELSHHRQIGKPGVGVVAPAQGWAVLHGDQALQAISRLMPHLNEDAGGKRQLRDAVDTLGGLKSVDELVRMAVNNDEARRTHLRVEKGRSVISTLPARIRLALEMALHEDDERRAMEGELAELERRWREADAIAKIADSLLLPEQVEAELSVLHRDETPKGSAG